MRGEKLRRLFTGFPSGWSGLALLLLRAVTGFTLMFQGVAYLSLNNLTLKTLAVGALSIASGTCLLVGLLTPVACLLSVVSSMGFALSWLPLQAQSIPSGNLVIVNLIVMVIAIAMLGPGAYSLDSRMFGRREIVIPASGRVTSTRKQRKEF